MTNELKTLVEQYEQLYIKVGETMANEVIKDAQTIVKESPYITDFYMSMGTACFEVTMPYSVYSENWEEDGWEEDETFDEEIDIFEDNEEELMDILKLNDNPCYQNIKDILTKWDETFYLTGEGIHIKENGEIDENY